MTLDQAMQAKGLSDQQLAESIGVSREAVRLWRAGRRRITASRVAAVSAATGIPAAELRPDLAAAFAAQPQEAA